MTARIQTIGLIVLCALSIASPAAARSEIGAVASATGNVEVRRASAGAWKPITAGMPIFAGDEFRTQEQGRAKLLFSDDAVLNLAANSTLAVKSFAAKSDSGANKSVFRLTSGALRALVGNPDAEKKARYEVETPTAVIHAERAAFLVTYDEEGRKTGIVGVEGEVDVQGAIGLIGSTIKVSPGERTEVQEGKFPIPVQAVEANEIASLQATLDSVGTGGRDGLMYTNSVLRGELPRSDEKPGEISPSAGSGAHEAISYLDPKAPGETLRDQLSPAARANTQPVLEYKYAAPDEVPQ
jgi:hypothetical protein